MVSEFQTELGIISDLQFSKTDDCILFKIKSDSFLTNKY